MGPSFPSFNQNLRVACLCPERHAPTLTCHETCFSAGMEIRVPPNVDEALRVGPIQCCNSPLELEGAVFLRRFHLHTCLKLHIQGQT